MLRVLSSIHIFLIALITTACAESAPSIPGDAIEKVVISSETGDHRMKVEIADDIQERSIGLMYRDSLPADEGMLFLFDNVEPVAMWMKDTLIPLDMAFIDENGVIIRIAADTIPYSLETIPSGGPVRAVLEVNGGVFKALGVKAGDTVRHPAFKKDK